MTTKGSEVKVVKIFISWAPGLHDDQEALRMVRDDPLVAGVETCDTGDEFLKLQAAGVEVSLHNPLREYRTGLSDPHFLEAFSKHPRIREHCLHADTSFIGFHVGYEALNKAPVTVSDISSYALRNLQALERLLEGKKVIFELPPFTKALGEANYGACDYVSSPEFLQLLLHRSSAGFLFDVAHMFIAGETKRRLGLISDSAENYFDTLLDVANGSVRQLHVNVPAENMNCYEDRHGVFGDDEMSRRVLALTKRIVDRSPNLEVITLEMSTGLPPQDHVRVLLDQARKLNEYLSLS